MNEVSLKIVIMSHLSDIECLTNFAEIELRVEFVKFLVLKYLDKNIEIDPDVEYELFQSSRGSRLTPVNN